MSDDTKDRARRQVVGLCPRPLCREAGQCMADMCRLKACRLRPPLDEIARGGQ